MTTEEDKAYAKRVKQSQKFVQGGEYSGTRMLARYLGMLTGFGSIGMLVTTLSGEGNNATGTSISGGILLSLALAGATYYLFTRK